MSHHVLITGASRGIGLEVARNLARSGDQVLLVARSREPLKRAVAGIRAEGGRADFLVGDVGSATSATKLAQRALRRFPEIDTLILNAGYAEHRLFARTSPQDLRREFEVNYFGPAALVHAFMDSPVGRKGGRILAVSSLTAEIPFPGHANYSASKAALLQLFRTLRVEWAGQGVQIGVVLPGLTQTEMTADLATILPAATPEAVARDIVDSLKRNDAIRVAGLDNRVVLTLARAFPGTFNALLGKFANQLVPGFKSLREANS